MKTTINTALFNNQTADFTEFRAVEGGEAEGDFLCLW